MNYTYLLRCADGTLYCGWTNDPEKRLAAHNAGTGAKYTAARRPVSLVHLETFATKQEAMKREAAIKRMKRKDKLRLIGEKGEGNMPYENSTLGEVLSDPRIAPIAADAIRERDLSKEELWDKTLLQLKAEQIFAGEIGKGIRRLYEAADTGEWYYPLYTEAESQACPTRKGVNLVYLPSGAKEAEERPFILLVPGGGFVNVWNLTEGWPIAAQFNKLGYHVFILTYQVGGEEDGLLQRNMEDFARALRLIRENETKFHVQGGAVHYLRILRGRIPDLPVEHGNGLFRLAAAQAGSLLPGVSGGDAEKGDPLRKRGSGRIPVAVRMPAGGGGEEGLRDSGARGRVPAQRHFPGGGGHAGEPGKLQDAGPGAGRTRHPVQAGDRPGRGPRIRGRRRHVHGRMDGAGGALV